MLWQGRRASNSLWVIAPPDRCDPGITRDAPNEIPGTHLLQLLTAEGGTRRLLSRPCPLGIEWNLACDRLDQQSDACLRTVAAFLR
jgi:hypothetical protein